MLNVNSLVLNIVYVLLIRKPEWLNGRRVVEIKLRVESLSQVPSGHQEDE